MTSEKILSSKGPGRIGTGIKWRQAV